jgi:hypothetical protein
VWRWRCFFLKRERGGHRELMLQALRRFHVVGIGLPRSGRLFVLFFRDERAERPDRLRAQISAGGSKLNACRCRFYEEVILVISHFHRYHWGRGFWKFEELWDQRRDLLRIDQPQRPGGNGPPSRLGLGFSLDFFPGEEVIGRFHLQTHHSSTSSTDANRLTGDEVVLDVHALDDALGHAIEEVMHRSGLAVTCIDGLTHVLTVVKELNITVVQERELHSETLSRARDTHHDFRHFTCMQVRDRIDRHARSGSVRSVTHEDSGV